MSLSRFALMGLLILCLTGCGARLSPFKQQAQRVANLSQQGEQSFSQGDLSKASKDFSQALEVSRSMDYRQGAARQLNNLGAVALEQGDLRKAADLFTQAWNINQSQQCWNEASVNQANLATVSQKAGRWEEAAQHLEQAQDAAQWAKSPLARKRVLIRWAGFYIDQKNYGSAADMLQQAQKLAATPSLKGALGYQRGRLALAQGDTAAALTNFHQALADDQQDLDRTAMAADLFSLGETHRLRGEMYQAFDSFSRAFDIYAFLGKKDSMARCLSRLGEVNAQGQLGNSLERFQQYSEIHPPGAK
jgi:tetratricopeptide (TPR) repeat protein